VTHLIRTIDAHVGGQSLRLLTHGAPRPLGRTIAHKRDWLRRRAGHLGRAVLRQPRGHTDLLAAQMTEPAVPGAHAGIVFMGASGYPAMSGHGVIAAATIAVERELLPGRENGGAEQRLTFETVAGAIHARCRVEQRGGMIRVDSVAFTNVPAYVQAAGYPVSVRGREIRVDIAFGGELYAIVDSEAVGIPLTGVRIPELRHLAADLTRALALPRTPTPEHGWPNGVGGVIFTGPPLDPESHLRTVTVSAGAGVNRSPSGTGMSAVMSVLDAMGLLPDDRPFVQEGLVGSLFRGRVLSRTLVGEMPAIATEIEGTAWITGEHTFYVDDDDPFREGFDA
jgi:proline racemase